MNYSTRLNPNILLTERCNQSCDYCFAKQKMSMTAKKEMSLTDILRLVDFLKKNKQNEIRLMGGEPTLHSQFKPIVNHILSRNLKIELFTNGLFSQELAHWLSEKWGSIRYIINLTTPMFQSESGKRIIENNLKTLKNSEIIAAITIDSLDFENGPIIDFIKKNTIESVRCGIANNLIGDSNWLKWEQYKYFGSIITSLIKRLNEGGISKLSFNCGFTPCMFEPAQIEYFLEKKIKIIGWGCDGQKGAFDISAELKIFPCFILEDFRAKNFLNFKDLKAAKKFIENFQHYTIKSPPLFVLDRCRNCVYFKVKCPGPCLGYVINESDSREVFKNFQNTFYFKFIYKLLYIFRNWH